MVHEGQNTKYKIVSKQILLIAGPACTITWEDFPFQLALGGVPVDCASTIAECKTTCASHESCRAIDFHLVKKCFMHVDGDWTTGIQTDKPQVNQYVISRVCQETTPTTTMLGTITFQPGML